MNALLTAIIILDILISLGLLITKVGRISYKKEGELFEKIDNYNPRTLVILPVKGIDFEMDKNLISLIKQSYSNFKIIAIADDENDPALDLVKKMNLEYIISDAKCSGCSGKVRAIYSALLKFRDYDCYVIADSDIRAEKDWLIKLISPLGNKEYGLSTTYPKFYPEGGFWSHFKMYWGMIGESMMESQITRFAWGGSLAFRNGFLDNRDLNEFSSSISDDISLLRISKRKGMKIAYVEDARVNVHSNDNFKTFIEWSNRQTALSIYSSNMVFIIGMIYYLLSSFLILSTILMIFFGYYIQLILLLPLLYISYENYRKAPVKNKLDIPLNVILYFFYLYSLVSGKRIKNITWRGNTYALKSKI